MSNTKQTERDTLASRETLITLIETLSGAFFFIDDTQAIVYANASAQAITGATLAELRGNSFWRSAPQLVSTALYQAVLTTRQTREPAEVEYGSPVTRTWLHVQLAPTVGGVMLQFHEVSAPARHQELVPTSQPFSGAVLDGLHAGIAVLTPEGIVLEINEAPLDGAHLRREEVIGKPLAKTPWWSFSPAGQEQLRAAIARASTGETVLFETLVHPREELFLHLEVVIIPHIDADHHIECLVMAGIEITARKRAEAELRVLIDAIPQFVWMLRPDGSSEYCNRRWRDYTTMTSQQSQGGGWLQAIHPDDYQRTLTAWHHARASGEPFEIECRFKDGKTGDYRWFLGRAMPVRDEAGQIVKWFGTNTDIDDQKRIEEALRQSQARIRALTDSNLIGIVSNEGEEEVIVEANEAFLQMTGYTQEDIDRRTLARARITLPEDAPLFERARQELAAHGQHAPFETELVCKDGSRLPILARAVTFQDLPRQFVAFMLDNSARKELERRKDDFINMASHELRNPLTILKLQTTLLHRQLTKQGLQDVAPALSNMQTQINAITRLVEELLDVSKIQAGQLEYRQETGDLDALLQEITDTTQQTHPSHTILVHGAVQASLLGDRDRLGEVFTNLLSNAIKYSPDAQIVEMDLSASPETATVPVRDHRLGIPREQREKIFERFYRAAGPQQRAIPGLGMGLYIVAEIIERHGGTIVVDSEVGKGSTFTVTLPLMRDA